MNFEREVNKQLQRDDLHDFSNFVFPRQYSFMNQVFQAETSFEFADFGHVNFSYARFLGEVSFWKAEFSEEAIFIGTILRGEVNFYGATFFKEATFGNATIHSRVQFKPSEFCRHVSFHGCILTETACLEFDNEHGENPIFQKGADFTSLTMHEGAVLQFRNISVENCRFLETDLRKAHFAKVKWPVRNGRPCVLDELAPDRKWIVWNAHTEKERIIEPPRFQYGLIAQVYRHLQTNFMESNRYSEAGGFHVGEQEMVRKAKGPIRQYFCTNMLYKLVSNYGESYGRPLRSLAAVLLLFPTLLLYGGINFPSANDAAIGHAKTVAYSFSLNPLDCFLFQALNGHYWTVVFKNISFLTYSRTALTDILTTTFQGALAGFELVIVVALISFFLLALRRQFKRKSF